MRESLILCGALVAARTTSAICTTSVGIRPVELRLRESPTLREHRPYSRPVRDEAPQTETGLRGFVVSRARQAVRAAGVRLRVVSTWSTMPYSIASAAERILSRSMSLLTFATS